MEHEEFHHDDEEMHEDHDLIEFEENDEAEHMRNFQKISRDLKALEEEYKECINNISDQVFTQEEIEECVGVDFKKVILDIKYETLKIISRGDSRVKEFFLEQCYKVAGTNEQFASACDAMERDILSLLWNAMDFVQITRINEDKYLSVISAMPRETFEELMNSLTEFSEEFFELMDEVDSHKEVCILRLKTLIDDRTKLIIEAARESAENPQPKIVTHQISIQTQINDPNLPAPTNLPDNQFENNLEAESDDIAELDETEGEGEGEDEGEGEEMLKHKTRKLKMATRAKKLKRMETIRAKQKRLEQFRKKNNGRYTRLFRDHKMKYNGLNRTHGSFKQRTSVGPLGRTIRKFVH